MWRLPAMHWNKMIYLFTRISQWQLLERCAEILCFVSYVSVLFINVRFGDWFTWIICGIYIDFECFRSIGYLPISVTVSCVLYYLCIAFFKLFNTGTVNQLLKGRNWIENFYLLRSDLKTTTTATISVPYFVYLSISVSVSFNKNIVFYLSI